MLKEVQTDFSEVTEPDSSYTKFKIYSINELHISILKCQMDQLQVLQVH